jgi:hypothetical protein
MNLIMFVVLIVGPSDSRAHVFRKADALVVISNAVMQRSSR